MAKVPSGEPDETADPQAADASRADKSADQVAVKAIGSFFEDSNYGGRLLHAGDTFRCDKMRAVELRANGLIQYVDQKLEDAATADDAPPTTDQGQPVITTRSIRRPRA